MAFSITAQDLRNQRTVRTRSFLALLESPVSNRTVRSGKKFLRQQLARFVSNVRVRPDDCWEWAGARKPATQRSYPMFSGRHAIAWAYEHIRGLRTPRRNDADTDHYRLIFSDL